MILLDTHVLIYYADGRADKLAADAIAVMDWAWAEGCLAVSAFTFWEIAMLRVKNRLEQPSDVERWRREQRDKGLVVVPVDDEIAVRSNLLEGLGTNDPADRIIVATAEIRGFTLATSDNAILAWPGDLQRLDTRP